MPLPIDIYDHGMPCVPQTGAAVSPEKPLDPETDVFLALGDPFHLGLEKAELQISHLRTQRHDTVFIRIDAKRTLNIGIKVLQGHGRFFAGCLAGTVRVSESNAWTVFGKGFYAFRYDMSSKPLWQLHLNAGICVLVLVLDRLAGVCEGPMPCHGKVPFSAKVWIVVKKIPDFAAEEIRKAQLDNWLAILMNDAGHLAPASAKQPKQIPGYFIEQAFSAGNRIMTSFDSFGPLASITGQRDMQGRYFLLAFHGLFGTTPKRLQKRVRMQKAHQMLIQGVPVDKVSESLGFLHVREFRSAYEGYFGHKPFNAANA